MIDGVCLVSPLNDLTSAYGGGIASRRDLGIEAAATFVSKPYRPSLIFHLRNRLLMLITICIESRHAIILCVEARLCGLMTSFRQTVFSVNR